MLFDFNVKFFIFPNDEIVIIKKRLFKKYELITEKLLRLCHQF